jgi:hypothetical protein
MRDMEHFASRAWGELGIGIVKRWAEFNERYFAGKLHPIPIIITPTLPFGGRIADCWSDIEPGRGLIRLNVPRKGRRLVADNNSLLHEMIHQRLFEAGEDASHASEGWRREIMRLQEAMTGKPAWAGRQTTKRMPGPDGKLTKIVLINKPKADGTPSLTQEQIARWPSGGTGISLGRLGEPVLAPTHERRRS